MTQKPHRQIRHSKRVSNETGTAISAMIGEPRPTRYQKAKDEIMTVLRRLPPGQRRTMLVDVAREIVREEGAQT